MIRMFVRHTVTDFNAWKRVYDDFQRTQKSLGVRAEAVFCGAESPEDVTVWHDFDDLATAQAFVDNAELHEAMKASGVVGEPMIWFSQRELPSN